MQVMYDLGSGILSLNRNVLIIKCVFLFSIDIKTTEIPHGPAHRMNCPKSSGPFLLFVLPLLSSFRSGTIHILHAHSCFQTSLPIIVSFIFYVRKANKSVMFGWIASMWNIWIIELLRSSESAVRRNSLQCIS